VGKPIVRRKGKANGFRNDGARRSGGGRAKCGNRFSTGLARKKGRRRPRGGRYVAVLVWGKRGQNVEGKGDDEEA
jgi:hypothetical protein